MSISYFSFWFYRFIIEIIFILNFIFRNTKYAVKTSENFVDTYGSYFFHNFVCDRISWLNAQSLDYQRIKH